jgi:hypothetical protein
MSTCKISGSCHCGNIHVEVVLTRLPAAYNPRACDCDFCRKHGASYISDPQGSVRLQIKDAHQLGKYRQGSGIAECIICRNCGVLVGVVYEDNGRLYAGINSKVIDGNPGFSEEVPVSPKTLPDDKKVERWKDIWFANVSIDVDSS